MEISLATIKAGSATLVAAGIDHIILPDGRFLIEASRESSRAAVKAWRKTPEYQQYLALKKKYASKIGIEGGYTLKFSKTKNKYVLHKMTAEEKSAHMARRKGQWTSPLMQPKEKKKTMQEEFKGGRKSGGRAARD